MIHNSTILDKNNRTVLFSHRFSLLKISSALFAIFVLLGLWLIFELRDSYDQVLKQASTRAVQRSQIFGQNLRMQFLASDYVLRDVVGRIQNQDVAFAYTDPQQVKRMSALLKEKGETVPDFFSMVFV